MTTWKQSCCWFKSLHRPRSGRRCHLLLALEALEDRTLPTTFTPVYVPYQAPAGMDPNGSPTPLSSSFSPAQITHGYGIDAISFNGGVVGSGAGQTIAIIDAYDNPDVVSSTAANFASSDLHTFDVEYGLPEPTGFFTKVDEAGGTNYPTVDPSGGWEGEEALDVEWAHAIAPQAKIILVEASAPDGNLFTAIQWAEQQSAVSVISMSWGTGEFSGETSDDSVFQTPSGHQGITFIASTGDSGQPGEWPAYSPNVVAVGGTSLTLNSNNTYASETGWSGSGGGISTQESEPSYQEGVQSSGAREIPDVSFDADPNTGVAVCDTYNYGASTPWWQFGGTSLGAPSWAGLVAIADQGRVVNGLGTLDGPSQTLAELYSAPSGDYHDITSGNNGFAAGPGYDLVTGRGTPVANLLDPALAGSTSTALVTSSSMVVVGQSFTLTATVTGAAPTGTVTFLNGSAPLGSSAVDASGQATLIVSGLGAGTYALTAVYGGDSANGPSTSPVVNETVAGIWNNFNGNPQHTGISTVAAQPTDQILWQTSINLDGSYFWHTGEPVFTPSDTVIVPVKVTSGGNTPGATNFELEAFNGNTGSLIWTTTSQYVTPSYSWLPPYQPVYDAGTNRVYFPGPGGTLDYISNPDNPGSSTPIPVQVAFYGTSNYAANETGYNSTIFIDTPLTVDNAGNVFFGFTQTGSNPSGINDGGVARVSATGAGAYELGGAAIQVSGGSGTPALGSAPALSNDGSIVYVAINGSNGPNLVGLNAATLAPEYAVVLSVPNSNTGVYLISQSTAAPMVAPDGTVYMGVFANSYDGSRGFMTHYSADLATEYTPGAFGWDDTASIIPTSMVPFYTGTSPYLILTKYNNYVAAETGSTGGNGVNEIAVVDPYATQTDPNNDPNPNMLVMQQILTVTSPTEDSGYINGGYPDATREWCTNGTAVDPASDSVFINNEDGYSYRWNLATDTLTQAVEITDGYGEPYTPTAIGPNGVVYAINGGTLFALGGYSNYTLTNVSSLTPSVVGQSVTFTTTLASTNGGAVPAGSITYSYTSGVNDPQNSTPVTLGTQPLVNGQASFTTSALVPDHYHIIASFSGDATDGYTAGSTTLVQVVLANPTTTVATSASPVTPGQSVTFTATVNPDGVFFVPLGNVSFMDGSTLLGTVPLNALDQSTSPSSSETATFTTSALPAGADSITAVYSGDLNFAGNTSSPLTQIVATPITITGVAVNGSTAPILSATETNSTVTITTDGAHGFAAGDPVVIAGVGAGYDGTYTIAAVATNSFTINFGSSTGLATVTRAGTATDTALTAGLLTNGATNATSQRSMVDSIVYTFNQAVNLGVNAITITVLGQGGLVPTVSYASPDGGVTWVLTFSGNGVTGNSIANGEYQIVLNNSAVSPVSGLGTLASSDTEQFYRLFGDTVGNGHYRVNVQDNNIYNGAFGSTISLAKFLAFLDFNDDGRINAQDNNIFNGDFGVRFLGFTATI